MGSLGKIFLQLENLTMNSHQSGRFHYNSWIRTGSCQTAITEHSQLRLDKQLCEEEVCHPPKSH